MGYSVMCEVTSFDFWHRKSDFRMGAITQPIMVDIGLHLVAKGNWTTIVAMNHQLHP